MGPGQEFNNAKHFLNNMILSEMKINRIGSATFFNRKPAKVESSAADTIPESNINDDSEQDVVEVPEDVVEVPEVVVERNTLCEYLLSPEMLTIMQKHYESLDFSWAQDEDKITIAWQ